MRARLALAFGVVSLLACGGIAHIDPGTGGSAGSAGSAGAGGSGGTGASAGTGGVGLGGGSGGSAGFCGSLGEVDCIAQFPSCVPYYDDACCPSCNPGGCADCVSWHFQGCADGKNACSTGSVPCGFLPDWACAGETPYCPDGQPCEFNPGCVEAVCSFEFPCPNTILCSPVGPELCTNQCDSVPPTCPDGYTAESDGFCYTGYCIPFDLCVIPL